MTNPYKRTHKTSLSDDELLLLDALFDKDLVLGQLKMKNFGVVNNFSRTHHFSDAELKAKLSEWTDAGILRTEMEDFSEVLDSGERRNSGPYYIMTEKGGGLWELEREPPWDRYIAVTFRDNDETGECLISIRSPHLATAEQYLLQVCQGVMYQAEVEKAQTIIHPDERLLEWKVFPAIYEILAAAEDPSPVEDPYNERPIDFTLYHARRTWWSTLEELQRLPAEPPHPL